MPVALLYDFFILKLHKYKHICEQAQCFYKCYMSMPSVTDSHSHSWRWWTFIITSLMNWPSSSSWKILWVVDVTCLMFTWVPNFLHSPGVCLYVLARDVPVWDISLPVMWSHSREAKDCSNSISKVVKDQCENIQHPISRKLFKILTTRMGKHNEITVSLIEDACLYSLSCLSLGLHVEFQSRSTLGCIISYGS
jgi:hypothetical protein